MGISVDIRIKLQYDAITPKKNWIKSPPFCQSEILVLTLFRKIDLKAAEAPLNCYRVALSLLSEKHTLIA